jgi:hypothetical protein
MPTLCLHYSHAGKNERADTEAGHGQSSRRCNQDLPAHTPDRHRREEIQAAIELCYPFFTATAIEHEPDNHFLEVALAVEADYLITVNTVRGHFDRKSYENVRVVTPDEFLKQREVQLLPADI